MQAVIKLISFCPQDPWSQKINLLFYSALTFLPSYAAGNVHNPCVDRLPVGLVDGAPSLQLSGGLAGVHPVPVDGSLEESRAT